MKDANEQLGEAS
jgi:uncharacterized integral membrane protein